MAEDINAILNRLKASHNFLGIDELQERVSTEQIVSAIRGETKLAEDAALAAHWQGLQREHESNIAKHGSPWLDERPTHQGRIFSELMIKKGSIVSLWLDNQKCTGMLRVMPNNKSYHLRFGSFERPVLDRLGFHRHTGEEYAFFYLLSSTFLEEARVERDELYADDPARRFQASTINLSQFQDSSLLTTGFARLYWSCGHPDKLIVMDGDIPCEFNLTSARADRWDSPTHIGSYVP